MTNALIPQFIVHRIGKWKMPFDRKWLDTISCTIPEILNEQIIPIYFISVNTGMNHYLFFMVTIHVHSMTLIKRPMSSQ